MRAKGGKMKRWIIKEGKQEENNLKRGKRRKFQKPEKLYLSENAV